MFDALQIAATGLQVQQQHVEAIANNLANVGTAGFKRSRVAFRDLVAPGTGRLAVLDGAPPPQDAARAGAGVTIAAIARSFDGGELRKTEMPLDLAIAGDGFLEVTTADGARAFTRGGTLTVNADGLLATASGHPLRPGVPIRDDVESLTIARDGKVQARLPGRTAPVLLGQLEAARFHDPGTLAALGDGLYAASAGSGEPISGRPGEDGMGALRQGFLEGSNVRLVDEFVNLMVAQRAYEANVKVVQACDDLSALVNNLRR